MFQGFSRVVLRQFQEGLRVFQGRLKEVSRKFPGGSRVSRKF